MRLPYVVIPERTMRNLRYSVAMSLDGFIATPEGGYGWIPHDPAIDFGAFFGTIDTILMGRKTFELVRSQGPSSLDSMRRYVFSHTLRPEDAPDVTLVSSDAATVIRELRAEEGKDIWLMGGGVLFRSLLEAGLVDTVEIGLVPVLLGRGIPLLRETDQAHGLLLAKVERFPSGVVLLKYDVVRPDR
jgi:dihydrofolate reductase